jgi:hypothetical protein
MDIMATMLRPREMRKVFARGAEVAIFGDVFVVFWTCRGDLVFLFCSGVPMLWSGFMSRCLPAGDRFVVKD